MVVGGDGSGSINTVNVIWRVLMHHQKNGTLPTDSDTRELHLQFDNCGDNKNWLVLGFCELLVHFKIFTKVTVYFLTVGHTHENIDQLFSVLVSDIVPSRRCELPFLLANGICRSSLYTETRALVL